MPKKIKPDDNQGVLTPDEFKAILANARKQEGLARGHQEEQRLIIRSAIEAYGLLKFAFAVVRRMSIMDDNRRRSEIRAMIIYMALAGFFDQRDSFDDLPDFIRDVIESGGRSVSDLETHLFN